MNELKWLINWYMLQYGYTWQEAIKSIRADLKDIENQIIEPVVLSGHFGT